MNLKHTLQSGRSMMEMLGVLAIIGVLSVGAIVGYSYGMAKYRANETINDVNLRGVDLVRQVATNQAPDLSEWPTVSQAGYTISEANLSADGEAYFSVSGMSQRVCEMVYEGIQNNQTTVAEINEATNGDATDCQPENNTMTFFFITTASENVVDLEKLCDNMTCPEGSSCTHGICMSEEEPQLNSDANHACAKSAECGECKECLSGWCSPLSDGMACRNNPDKTCKNGVCVNDKSCIDNSQCQYGYYCGSTTYNGNKTCIKAEFYKIKLNDTDEIYLSQQNFYLSSENSFRDELDEIQNLCDAVGLTLLKDISSQNGILNKFKKLTLSGSGPTLVSEMSSCWVHSDSGGCEALSNRGGSFSGMPICVKEDKIYEYIEQTETETETETTTGG